jgi:hypothetical protein
MKKLTARITPGIRTTILTLLLTTLLVACAQQDSHNEEALAPPTTDQAPSAGYPDEESRKAAAGTSNFAAADALANTATDSISSLMSSSAASPSPAMDTSHQFIRTADVRYRVNEVRTATFAIEKIVARFGGYVAHTGLESTINDVKNTQISDDSTLVTTYYTVHNNMTLRIPVINLDSTLRAMGPWVEYLDYRRINVVDATLMILRERLAARRTAQSLNRLAANTQDGDGKLRDRVAVEDALYNKQTMADESYLRTLELQDQIRLSTINLQIYQRQAWTREMIANEKNIDAYRPGFWHDLGEALSRGWDALKALVVGAMHFWPFFVLVIGFVVVWRVLRKRNRA